MSAKEPASGSRSAALVLRISEVMFRAVCEGNERFYQRPHGNRRVGMIPARGQSAPRMGIQQQKRNVATGEVTVQRLRGGLCKQGGCAFRRGRSGAAAR